MISATLSYISVLNASWKAIKSAFRSRSPSLSTRRRLAQSPPRPHKFSVNTRSDRRSAACKSEPILATDECSQARVDPWAAEDMCAYSRLRYLLHQGWPLRTIAEMTPALVCPLVRSSRPILKWLACGGAPAAASASDFLTAVGLDGS